MSDHSQSTLSGANAAQLARLKHLTEVDLPALAAANRWPIRLDHCFKRICFDFAFEDVWYRHIAKPAERHLKGAPLLRALQCAEDLAANGLPLLEERNRSSLHYRGKQSRSQSQVEDGQA